MWLAPGAFCLSASLQRDIAKMPGKAPGVLFTFFALVKGEPLVSFWMISHQEVFLCILLPVMNVCQKPAKFATDVGLINYTYLGVYNREVACSAETGSMNRTTMSRSRGVGFLCVGFLRDCQWMTSVLSRGSFLWTNYPQRNLPIPSLNQG